MMVHIGSGSVYLHGYLNIDIRTPHTFLAANRPDLVNKLGTTEDRYYAKHEDKTLDTFRNGALKQDYVCDNYGSFSYIPVPSWGATEILARHSFEHLSVPEARAALETCDEVLAPGGILRLDVPDHEESLRLLGKTGDTFYARHLLGPRRDDRGYHVMAYSREMLIRLCADYGFKFQFEEPNIHIYPAFCLRFIKSQAPPPREYALPPFPFEENWKIADVGPGDFPLLRANAYIDASANILSRLRLNPDQKAIESNLDAGLPGIVDQEFDYVWCSHVLEHVKDPLRAAAALQRIGKRGTVVLPGFVKESLFLFEEADHKWLIMEHPSQGHPLFIRRGPTTDSIIDVEVQKILSRLYRTGPNRHEEQQVLRNWFATNEKALDVIVHWNKTLKVDVIQ